MRATEQREFLTTLFEIAYRAADPALVLPQHLPPPPQGRVVVVGAGKAAAAMARAVEAHWEGPLSGLVITRHGQSLPTKHIKIVEAAHPLPDDAGQNAARAMLDLVGDLRPDDLVLCLISGGGSALTGLPAPGLSLQDKRQVTEALLRSGASIQEINIVRKHLSAIKGGRLAAAAFPAQVVTLAISDVPGDDPAIIASGLTVPDPSTFADARSVLRHYRITVPEAVAQHLATSEDETPKPDDSRLANARFTLIATPFSMLEAVSRRTATTMSTVLCLGDAIEGEAREVAKVHAGIARSIAAHGRPVSAPALILSGGETTVTHQGGGRGGRNAEFFTGALHRP